MNFNPETSMENSLNKIKWIKEYIDVHLTEDIGLSEIAEEFEISRYYLCHLFILWCSMSTLEDLALHENTVNRG